MKIKNQYKRLLKEDDSDFLDGNVNFRNIGNKIDKPIAKLFCNLMKNDKYLPNGMTTENLKSGEPSNNSQFSIIKNRIMELGGYTHSESILLLYNYIKLYEEFDLGSNNLMIGCDKLIGTPLEFYGKFSHYANIQHTAYVSGWSTGSGEFYTTSYDDFIDKWENGEVEIIDTGDNIDYECYDLYWETNWDYTYDNLADQDFDGDEIHIDID
jgi:hypothetical protein